MLQDLGPVAREFVEDSEQQLMFMDALAAELEARLIRNAPFDKGGLRASIKARSTARTIKIHMVDYGVYLDGGTGLYGPKKQAYKIRPKDKKALSWGKQIGTTKDGKPMREHIAKEVTHPGIQPIPWIRNTLYHDLPEIIKNIASDIYEEAEIEIEYYDDSN